ATEDLLAKAERILRSEGEEMEGRLFQTAQALRAGDTIEAPELPTGDFKSFEELLAEVTLDEASKGFGEDSFLVEEMGEAMPLSAQSGTEWPELPSAEPELPSEAAFSEGEAPAAPSPENLPEVITADMLRARLTERKKFTFSDEDFEVPAELLAGYEEEQEEGDASAKTKTKTKSKGKGKAPAKGKAKKATGRRPWEEDDF
ncbi:MAG: hypothetical protein ACKO4U_04340, partial [Caldilinea sp.]